MSNNEYLFHDASDAAELERLRMLESVFDEKSRRWLASSGPLAGRRCLEVGAGAGSIAEWLGSEVGATGSVMAVDTNARFIRRLEPKIAVLEGELRAAALPARSFDLVHARYVLIHNADSSAVLDAMVQALKPGGVLVLEEPDFSAAAALTGPASLKRSFESVQRALAATFAERGMNYAFGAMLPDLVQRRIPALVSVEYDSAVDNGASNLAKMMSLSTLALQHQYVATGLATKEDITGYAEFAATSSCWAAYYATVRVLARKQAE